MMDLMVSVQLVALQNANIISSRITHSVWYIYTDRLCRNSFKEKVARET